jgi:hypothetical protein
MPLGPSFLDINQEFLHPLPALQHTRKGDFTAETQRALGLLIRAHSYAVELRYRIPDLSGRGTT